MGPPGSGKTSIGRILARLYSLPLIDVDDDHLEPLWRTSVANKLSSLGDDGFIDAEGQALKQLNVTNTIISLTGSNPLHPSGFEHIAKDGIIVYLDVDPSDILARCERMKVTRIVGQSTSDLASILARRHAIYENCYDLRVIIPTGEPLAHTADRIVKALARAKHGQRFVSTRGYGSCSPSSTSSPTAANPELDFLGVVHRGLSPDRGLFVPSVLSDRSLRFSAGEMKRLAQVAEYEELALRVMERFPLGSTHPSALRSMLKQAYASFAHSDVLPLVPLLLKEQANKSGQPNFHPRMFMMETFHGPTASFKDLSLQLLPKLVAASLVGRSSASESSGSSGSPSVKPVVGLLVATSGDTGTAALDGFIRSGDSGPIVVLYPSNGVSIVQRAQMQTCSASGVLVLGVDADFDFCQKLVKDVFGDAKLKDEFRNIMPALTFSSANSMNWGRFLPQIVFSFSSYLRLVRSGSVVLGEVVDLVIPTGNFGNILGAVYASRVLGLPLGRIICASNSNKVLYDFLQTGVYDLRGRKFEQTVSPSIDILVSSNLERFLHLLIHTPSPSSSSSSSPSSSSPSVAPSDCVASLFAQLAAHGHFTVSPELLERMRDTVQGGWASETECLAAIKDTHERTGRFIDPHTSVAVHVANSLLAPSSLSSPSTPVRPVIISSTAHYSKFPNALAKAFGVSVPKSIEDDMSAMLALVEKIDPDEYQRTKHRDIEALKEKKVLHAEHCAAEPQIIIDRIKAFLVECNNNTR